MHTAFVQFLSLRGETVFLELIAPDSPQSRLANGLKKGEGINHICYAAPAIEDAIAALQMRRHILIHPPEPAVAFRGRRVAWLMNRNYLLIELVEQGGVNDL